MSTKTRETIKSIILVVLFLTTILLLYLLTSQNQKIEFSKLLPFKMEDEEASIKAEDLVLPNEIIYSNAKGDVVSVAEKEELFKNLKEYLYTFSRQGASMVTEITKEQLDEAMLLDQSLEFYFGYSIPFTQLCNAYDVNRTTGYGSIKNVSSILLSDAAKDSVIIIDSKNDKYYRIISESTKGWASEVIKEVSLEGDNLYPASQVLGVEKDMYIPVAIKRNVEEVYYLYEEFSEGSFALEDVSEAVFGETISFVRRIKDSFGNLTYMYGYGEKTLSVTADGTLEYKNTALENGESNGFYSDLQTAINFVVNCGGWGSSNSETKLRLSNVEQEGEGKNAIYTFYFVQERDGEEISGEEKVGMTLTVEKGQVSSYFRKLVIAIKSYAEPVDVLQAANAIALVASDKFNDSYEYTTEQIDSMKTCYRMINHFLIPSWEISFKDGSRTWIGLSQSQF